MQCSLVVEGTDLARKAIMCLEQVGSLTFCYHFRVHDLDMQGTATRDDIDKTLRLGMNHPMGPLQLGGCSLAWSISIVNLLMIYSCPADLYVIPLSVFSGCL